MYAKIIKGVLFVWLISLCSCASHYGSNTTADAWADAALIAEQAAVIEQQRRTLDDMESAVESVRDSLEAARIDVDSAIGETTELRSLFEAIKIFVEAVISAERQLEELQRPDR